MLGTEASCAITDEKDIYATAAVNKDGKLAILGAAIRKMTTSRVRNP